MKNECNGGSLEDIMKLVDCLSKFFEVLCCQYKCKFIANSRATAYERKTFRGNGATVTVVSVRVQNDSVKKAIKQSKHILWDSFDGFHSS